MPRSSITTRRSASSGAPWSASPPPASSGCSTCPIRSISAPKPPPSSTCLSCSNRLRDTLRADALDTVRAATANRSCRRGRDPLSRRRRHESRHRQGRSQRAPRGPLDRHEQRVPHDDRGDGRGARRRRDRRRGGRSRRGRAAMQVDRAGGRRHRPRCRADRRRRHDRRLRGQPRHLAESTACARSS